MGPDELRAQLARPIAQPKQPIAQPRPICEPLLGACALVNYLLGFLKGAQVAKALLYRLFGVGKIPASIAGALKGEGVLLMDEGLGGSVTYRAFRAPGKSFGYKRKWYVGSIILTEVRILGLGFSSPIIDVPLTDQRLRRMQFSVEGNDVLLVAFDASLFHDDWSGSIEYRFRTPHAHEVVQMLGERAG